MAEGTSEMYDELTENDIPGAILTEPLEKSTVPALKWWLLCRGIQAPSSWRKAILIEKIRKVKVAGTKVVDVDGSYLHRKRQSAVTSSHCDVDTIPEVPLIGWESIDSTNSIHIDKIPKVTHGFLYSYLADCAGKSGRVGAFRSLQRGFAHWSSGRLRKLEINFRHHLFCHVRCQMTPSMKKGLYTVYILLGCDENIATIHSATCECAAGKSASCTHVSALLHALASLSSPVNQQHIDVSSDEEAPLHITSYLCKWNAPSKRKESRLPIVEAVFQKHVYGRQRKHELKSMEDFDPRPVDQRGQSKEHLKTFLGKVRGQGLGVSLLFDEECRCWSSCTEKPLTPQLPTKDELKKRVEDFKKSLFMPSQKLREIEQSTRDQNLSPLWHSVRRYRITASVFGSIYHRKPTTPPQALVLQILGLKPFTSVATNWGIRNESIALEKYKEIQNDSGLYFWEHHQMQLCMIQQKQMLSD